MPSTLLKTLFRGVPQNQHRFPLDARLRLLAASVIEQEGDARRVQRFLGEYAGFWSAIARRGFPSRPSEIRPLHAVELKTAAAAIEFSALSLLPSVESLNHFEDLRERVVVVPDETPDAILSSMEEDLGYSNWLAGLYVGNLPPHSKLQAKLVQAIRDDDGLVLTTLFIQERYALSCYSLASTDIGIYLRRKKYPPSLMAFLSLALDPHPNATEESIRQALSISIGLPAVDRWMLLLRSLQTIAVHHGAPIKERLAGLTALRKLLSELRSVEGHNVAVELGLPCPVPPPPMGDPDKWLVSFASGETPPSEDSAAKLFHEALSGLSNESLWAGNAAVLDRQALAGSGTRYGGIAGSTTRQVTALSERRALGAMHWLRLNVHPEVLRTIPMGNIARLCHQASLPAQHRVRYGRAADALLSGQYETVAQLLCDAPDRSDEEAAILLDALLVTQRHDSAIEIVSNLLVSESPLVKRIPFGEVDMHIPADPAERLRDAVMRSIAAEACVRYGASADLTKRNDCFDDVLTLAGTRIPSDTVEPLRESGISAQAMVYFLHRLCTCPIMDTVPVGRSTEELLAERIRVLNALRSLDESQAGSYELESREVAMEIAAKKEMATLDQQRVYVDVDGLRSRLTVLLADDFELYRRFARLDPRKQEAAAMRKFVSEYLPDMTVVDMQELLRALSSEADSALSKMVTMARDEFALSHEFGLDGYLSGGIRHGNLEALLREPFVKMDLLGTFWSTGEFQPPALALVLGREEAAIACFASFARSFQGIIEEVLSEWIRIDCLDGSSRALFDLSIEQTDIRLIESKVHNVNSIDDFVDHLMRYWLARVDECLDRARDRIVGELRDRIQAIHDDLDRGLRRALPEYDAVIDNVVAPARGGIDGSIEKLTDWFRRVSDEGAGSVDPQLPIEISESLMKYMFPHVYFDWKVKVNADGFRLTRRALKPWVDILHTLLMNAVKHGGSVDECVISIDLTITDQGTTLTIMNKLGPNVGRDHVDSEIRRALERLRRKDAIAATTAEGNTGFVKVLKWATVNLRAPKCSLKIAREGEQFVVELAFPAGVAGVVYP